MTVYELKQILEGKRNDAEVVITEWNGQHTVIRHTNQNCNIEHQEKRNEVWLSGDGFIKTVS